MKKSPEKSGLFYCLYIYIYINYNKGVIQWQDKL